jgi:A/G-specific adenine glycosylase
MPGKGNLIPSVTVFPMKKAKKASRDEDELVCIVETEGDERKWLFTKRPEKGGYGHLILS